MIHISIYLYRYMHLRYFIMSNMHVGMYVLCICVYTCMYVYSTHFVIYLSF